MKKYIRVITAVISLLLIFSVPVFADANEELYDSIDMGSIEESLEEDTSDYLSSYGITPQNGDWVNSLSAENVFTHISNFLQSGMKRPLRSGASLIAVILITAAMTAFGSDNVRFAPALYAAVLACAAIIITDVWQCVAAAADTAKGCCTFMLAFIPVFAAVTALSGQALTSASMSAVLLAAAEGISAFASFALLPLTGSYLSLSLCESVSPLIGGSGISETVKKISTGAMSFVTVIFSGILGIQTAVNSATDSLAIKTTKFIVGTSVPVAGAALSEAASTIYSSMSLLRSTAGVYAVFALSVMMLPIICELLIWRVTLSLCRALSEMFGIPKFAGLMKAVDAMLAVLCGALLLIFGMFAICLTVVISAGG